MQKILTTISALAILASCGEGLNGPVGGGGGGGGSTTAPGATEVPAEVAGSLKAATYNASAGTLTMDVTGLDSPGTQASFTRDASLDIVSADGTTTYQAFRTQTTSDNRYYLAYFASGNSVFAGITGTEAEFATSFGGTTFQRINTTDIPASGSAVFHTGYVGIVDQRPTGLDRPLRVTGDAFISVNLTEDLIEGGVTNRAYADPTGLPALLPIALKVTDLDGAAFAGNVTTLTGDVLGDYAGTLGGTIANTAPGTVAGQSPEEVAVTMVFNPYKDPIIEWGGFVAPVCGGPAASPSCP